MTYGVTMGKAAKPLLHPLYPWKCDMVAHSDKKRQRKSKIESRSLRQAREIKYRQIVFI